MGISHADRIPTEPHHPEKGMPVRKQSKLIGVATSALLLGLAGVGAVVYAKQEEARVAAEEKITQLNVSQHESQNINGVEQLAHCLQDRLAGQLIGDGNTHFDYTAGMIRCKEDTRDERAITDMTNCLPHGIENGSTTIKNNIRDCRNRLILEEVAAIDNFRNF